MYGIDGNRSRCAPFWDEFLSCVNRVGRRDHWEQCRNYREDYMECLHHKKLVRKILAKFPHSPILHYACGSMCVVLSPPRSNKKGA